MEIQNALLALKTELDRTHQGAFPWAGEPGIPEFVTTENRMQRFFNAQARELLRNLCVVLHQNRATHAPRIELDGYITFARQAIADMHAQGDLSALTEENRQTQLALRDRIERMIASVSKIYTHHFQCRTIGLEAAHPFRLGPVVIFARNDWVDSVDFSETAKNAYGQSEENQDWREVLKLALARGEFAPPDRGLARSVYEAIFECPALATVSVGGYERHFSRKLGRLVSKTALDALSLGFGPQEVFEQQTLHDERLPPMVSDSLISSDGHLSLPGRSLSSRVRPRSEEQVAQGLASLAPVLPAFAHILAGLVDPSNHPHPELATRWSTALDWFAEGQREPSDAIALAKLATCLDVLSAGGKSRGIAEMISHLTGTPLDCAVTRGIAPRTLTKLVEDIYNFGRSQILHGTRYRRLEAFAEDRHNAAYLGRLVLLGCAQRLLEYTGADFDRAFRTIPLRLALPSASS